ncbi:EPIDERMAL PATTERNING FACTOR-like protein 2 [Cornus florida]|uniref:EPIDERMAL PATTERNING FACTOR-like protein 2 n=1 Tax=Cornus florida TaxID=4283 RepID=UPI00289DC3EE|nr:EPIDERMAL PATTERNING FACTOR-like protein 2 [Cornus florida]
MGCIQNCICCHQYRTTHLIIYLLFFLISSLTHGRFMAEGRAIPKLVQTGKNESEVKVVVVVRAMLIGSRPPRCERRCRYCGHCEAIQVPVAPQLLVKPGYTRRHYFSSALPSMAYSRGDDISNYKPMCWKCKCGDLIFNP